MIIDKAETINILEIQEFQTQELSKEECCRKFCTYNFPKVFNGAEQLKANSVTLLLKWVKFFFCNVLETAGVYVYC